jgi:hypothetical protein
MNIAIGGVIGLADGVIRRDSEAMSATRLDDGGVNWRRRFENLMMCDSNGDKESQGA